MLSSEELNAFLRDERVWRRAAQRPVKEDVGAAASSCSREGNWPLFRRGTSDNAFTLKFANSLRPTAPTNSRHTTTASSTASNTRAALPRRPWNTSARCTPGEVAVDPLQLMLSRNLQDGRSPSQRARPQRCTVLLMQERERCRAAERVNRELVELERVSRREIAAAARTHWNALTTSFFTEASALLFVAELNDRRVLFRAWQSEKYMLSASLSCERGLLTNMTARQFKQQCHLIQAEMQQRSRLAHDEEECRDLLARFAYVEYLQALESEIEACRQEELRLLRRMA